ncbi:MAG: hypothetical protein NTV51_28980 [Verrucomicrobia bacterium]|nr:hypothetical protein [Verrucomicrobiota bacterium]
MKTLLILVGCLAGLAVLLYGCTHEISYQTNYPRVAKEIEQGGLSDTGEVLIATAQGYLVVSVLEAAKRYPNGFQRRADLSGKAALPKWTEMARGPVPSELWKKYPPVRVIRDGIAATNYFDRHNPREEDALVTFENEAYAHGEDFAWLELRLYSNRPLYRGLRPSSAAQFFWIEIPATLESHWVWKRTKFLSIGG